MCVTSIILLSLILPDIALDMFVYLRKKVKNILAHMMPK